MALLSEKAKQSVRAIYSAINTEPGSILVANPSAIFYPGKGPFDGLFKLHLRIAEYHHNGIMHFTNIRMDRSKRLNHLLLPFKNDKFAQNIDMHRLISDNIGKIKALCITHNVDSLFAFGSVCTEHFDEHSDIDLLISFKPMDYGDYTDTYFDLADKFENLFNRTVDLVTDKSLSNPYFIESMNQTKTLLYGN